MTDLIENARSKRDAVPHRIDNERLYVELLYCRTEAALSEQNFLAYLLEMACETVKNTLERQRGGEN